MNKEIKQLLTDRMNRDVVSVIEDFYMDLLIKDWQEELRKKNGPKLVEAIGKLRKDGGYLELIHPECDLRIYIVCLINEEVPQNWKTGRFVRNCFVCNCPTWNWTFGWDEPYCSRHKPPL